MNVDKLIKKFELTGECEIDVSKVVKKWDKNFRISQWNDEYTLLHHNRNATNFTRTDLKVRISKQQAKELIVELDLMPEQSAVFKNGNTWKLADNPQLKSTNQEG